MNWKQGWDWLGRFLVAWVVIMGVIAFGRILLPYWRPILEAVGIILGMLVVAGAICGSVVLLGAWVGRDRERT